jgi:predicted CopG family antitoxin
MKPIKLKDETYWQLREMRDERAKDLKHAVSFDDVIQYLFTRRLISLRQGE